MKNTKNIFVFVIPFIIAGISSCSYDRDLEEGMPPVIDPVENLKVELQGDTAHVTWQNPTYEGNLDAIVTYNGGTQVLENARNFDYGIIDVNVDYLFSVKLRDDEGNYSLGKSVSLLREGPAAVESFKGVQEGNNVNLSWSLPEEEFAGVRLWIGSEEIILDANATSYTLTDAEFGTYNFRINVIDAEGNTSPSRYLNFTVGATKIAYLGVPSTVSNLTDDDVLASASWLFENYPEAEYLSFEDIKAGADLSDYRVIWWHYDEDDNDPSLPEIAKDPEVVSAITEFHKDGGGLLLNTHAVQYLYTIGRLEANFGTAVGAGEGFDNPDAWGVNVNIGRTHDKSIHPLYEGITVNDVDGRKIIPLIGPGWKEDHNYVFTDIAAFYDLGNADEAAYMTVSENSNLNILGTWDGITDYFMMGIFETLPTEEFEGNAIAIGLGSFEWNQNSGGNQYRGNIEAITRNALEYLKVQ